MAHEGVPLIVIQRQLGHSNLGITSVYLQGIDNAEIIEAVHSRRAPMVPVTTTLRLSDSDPLVARSRSRRGVLSRMPTPGSPFGCIFRHATSPCRVGGPSPRQIPRRAKASHVPRAKESSYPSPRVPEWR